MSGSFAHDVARDATGDELMPGAAPDAAGGAAAAAGDGAALALPPRLEGGAGRYRDLVSRLLFGTAAEERVVLAVTSAASGEGVTDAAATAALALAQSTSGRVLVLDANLRRPAIHRVFGVADRPGFLQVVEECADGSAPIASASWSAEPYIQPTALGNLWVMPAGGLAEDPTRLLTSDVATLALRFLTARFDYTVIDCPPLLRAVDAVALCRVATSVAVVVRAGRTPRDDVQRACERLRGFPLLGVLLTGVEGGEA